MLLFPIPPSRSQTPPLARFLGLVLTLALVSVSMGCSSSEKFILPTDEQEQEVRFRSSGGYDFLASEIDDTEVVLSLRSATPRYVQMLVTVSNNSPTPVTVLPTEIDVKAIFEDGKTETFQGYEPEDVPIIVRRDAQETAGIVRDFGLQSLGVIQATQSLSQWGGEDRGTSSGAYGSDPKNDTYLNLMFRETLIQQNQAVNGLVYAPFKSSVQRVQITIPVGSVSHTFSYRIERRPA